MTLLNDLPIQRLQFYLTAPYPCSYLPERKARSQVAAPGNLVDASVFGELARMGFRRSGQHVYRPRCDACAACVPARLVVDEFEPSRTQRRCLSRNADLRFELKPLVFDESHYRLYRRYQVARHAGSSMEQDDREQYRSFLLSSRVDSALAEYTLEGEVVMVSLIDRLLDGISAVYTFFDPELPRRSLGVYGVLRQIELARSMAMPYLYLGYWIRESPKMAYKVNYQPLEILRGVRWQRFDAGDARFNAHANPLQDAD